MADYDVTGVNVEHRGTTRERITKLCGVGFSLPVDEVLRRIASGDTFRVQVPGQPRVKVHPVHPKDGRPGYVTTSPDGTTANNLLSLTSTCP